MVKVAGEPSSDVGDNESGDADWKAKDALEYGNQESREDKRTYKWIAVFKADHPNQISNHAVAWRKTVTHQKKGSRAPATRTGTFGYLHRDGGLRKRSISTLRNERARMEHTSQRQPR